MASIIKVGAKWRVQIRRKGQPTKTKTFSTKVLAQAWAKTREGDAEHMQAGIMPTGKAHTVGKLIDRYDSDPRTTPPDELADVRVRATYLSGRSAYAAAD